MIGEDNTTFTFSLPEFDFYLGLACGHLKRPDLVGSGQG